MSDVICEGCTHYFHTGIFKGHCFHESCFTQSVVKIPSMGRQNMRTRVKDEYDLNAELDCELFKQRPKDTCHYCHDELGWWRRFRGYINCGECTPRRY